MLSKNIASSTHPTKLASQKQLKNTSIYPRTQRGVTLIELMVGITIGLLTVAVAMGALMVSRGISGTVNDASNIQQQAAYAMRVIGLQLRQAGSLRLNLQPGTNATAEPYLAAVAFETTVQAPASAASASIYSNFDPAKDTLNGTASPATFTVGYRRYTEPVFTSLSEESMVRNCVGGPIDNSTDQSMTSTFQLDGTNLRCSGNGDLQPIVGNVANFQVRYLIQDNASTPGDSKVRSVDASGVTNWGQVQAVEVCLVLYGNEAMDIPGPTSDTPKQGTYTDCDGTAVSMNALTGVRNKRMHIAFRNTFQLRSQGLIGSVL